jgi:hypothetical protein
MKRYELIYKYLQDQTEDDLIFIHNQWCGDFDTIYPMEAFDQIMSGKSPLDIATMLEYSEGEFFTRDNFFSFDFDGDKVISSSDPCHHWIDIEILADYIDSNSDDLGIPDLEEILETDDAKAELIVDMMHYIDRLSAVNVRKLFDKYNTKSSYLISRYIIEEMFK